jgi:hypothetical protein
VIRVSNVQDIRGYDEIRLMYNYLNIHEYRPDSTLWVLVGNFNNL